MDESPSTDRLVRTSGSGSQYIGNYRVIKTLGQGNFARVKSAEHVLTGEEVRHVNWADCAE